jgi:CIC family chloride channel protein
LRTVEKLFAKIKKQYVRAIVGGLLLGVLILFFPVFYGEGYENLNTLLQGKSFSLFQSSPFYPLLQNYHILFVVFLIGVILLKVIATAITTGAGGIGGAFAPSLFVGAFTGFLLVEVCNYYFRLDLPYINFILAGMAGVMAGVMHAPLTAIFLIVELSTGYSLLIPLMITASISYLSVFPFEKHSIYTRKLAEKGELKTHNKDKFAMRQLNIDKLLDTDILTIPVKSSLRDYTSYIAKSKRNLFVVLDEYDTFAGLLVMDQHRDILFNQELYDLVRVKDLMIQPDVFVYDTDKGEEIVQKFQKTNNYNLPVITKENKYIGFLSKATVFSAYKNVIASESED